MCWFNYLCVEPNTSARPLLPRRPSREWIVKGKPQQNIECISTGKEQCEKYGTSGEETQQKALWLSCGNGLSILCQQTRCSSTGMGGSKKPSRRNNTTQNRKLSACKRRASNKKRSQLEGENTNEKPSTPSWVEPDSDEEYWADGYNNRGYDREGFSKSGFNKHGFRKTDYGPDGFNIFGFDSEGYSKEGRNVVGLTRADYDVDGYDAYGADCYGYDRQGLNRYGYSATDYSANGFDKNGYTKNGLFHDVPGTSMVPVRYAMVRKGQGDPVYRGEVYGKLRDHASLVILNAKLEREKLYRFEDLTTELSLKWTAWTSMHALGLL
ncbi:hypothetical protein O3P69_002066 [Scylla paramamosain]|uniref:Uncharacterized protein n=1 Tax=Scylla paramamosain TaxID=85552 RepID=A0AAW0V4Z7_SCYPA